MNTFHLHALVPICFVDVEIFDRIGENSDLFAVYMHTVITKLINIYHLWSININMSNVNNFSRQQPKCLHPCR